MPDRAQAAIDIGVSLLFIAIAAAFIYDGWDLGPGYFEPVGPGPIPTGVAWVAIGLALTVIAQTAWRHARGAMVKGDPPPYRPARREALAVSALLAAYVAAMGLGWVGFAPATAIFLALAIWILAEFDPRALIGAAVIAPVMSFGLAWLFTRVLVTDLP